MKYWIFQNNQVLGPYEPGEMGKISMFSPESLVCPEGRRGTSMGDWQRAGMVPDLSVALVRANSSGEGKTAVLSIAGLPPEPTLKDLAQLGSIQEKMAMLEEVVLQMQEGLRAKDTELATVHQELSGKSRESDELKRQIAGLEDRLSSVRVMSETLDKAVEEEKRVEHDVEKHGQALTDLVRDVEDLRRQLDESKTRQAELAASAHLDAMKANQAPSAPFGGSVPTPSSHSPAASPAMAAVPIPSFESSLPPIPGSAAPNFDPMAFGDTSADALAPETVSEPAVEVESFGVVAPPPPAPRRKRALLIGTVVGIAALGCLAVMGGFVPGINKPKTPAAVLEPTPLPPPEPAPIAAPDSRLLAVEFAKEWQLPGDRTLERALESLAPSAGNLSPWMAEPLAGGRFQVNYFARSSAPGAPTIAYEFQVDLEGKTLVGRNAAAKSILTGKAAVPPAPPKPKPVKVKPMAPEKMATEKMAPEKMAPEKAPEEETLDSMLGDDSAKAEVTTLTDTGDAPSDKTADGENPRPSRANPARRAEKAKGGKAPAKGQPADKTLLDDLLKE